MIYCALYSVGLIGLPWTFASTDVPMLELEPLEAMAKENIQEILIEDYQDFIPDLIDEEDLESVSVASVEDYEEIEEVIEEIDYSGESL